MKIFSRNYNNETLQHNLMSTITGNDQERDNSVDEKSQEEINLQLTDIM